MHVYVVCSLGTFAQCAVFFSCFLSFFSGKKHFVTVFVSGGIKIKKNWKKSNPSHIASRATITLQHPHEREKYGVQLACGYEHKQPLDENVRRPLLKNKLWLNFTSRTGHRSVRKTCARFDTREEALAASDAFRASWQYSVRGKVASADTVYSLLGSTPAEEIAVLPPGKFGKLYVFADIKF